MMIFSGSFPDNNSLTRTWSWEGSPRKRRRKKKKMKKKPSFIALNQIWLNQTRPGLNQTKPNWARMSQNEPEWAKLSQIEPGWTRPDQNEPNWARLNQNEPVWAKLNQFEPNLNQNSNWSWIKHWNDFWSTYGSFLHLFNPSTIYLEGSERFWTQILPFLAHFLGLVQIIRT